MFVAITNTPRDYAWGSTTLVPSLLGTPVTGEPQAELWLGTHPGSPSRYEGGLLSDLTTLPFLLKVLGAASPLSLQAHPTIEQAVAGYARENALGIPLDAPHRNYRDELHKPEILFALTPFRALCGFRTARETRDDLARLVEAAPDEAAFGEWMRRLGGDGDIQPVFAWLLSRGPGVAELLAALPPVAARLDGPRFALVGELAAAYPGDPGIAVSLMLNLAELQPGEALFLPAGNIHAYIEGLGVELMAASDNVLRGGLTPKHVDVDELLAVLDFTPLPVPYCAPESLAPGVVAFRPVPDFQLVRVTEPAALPLAGEALLLCTRGALVVNGTAVTKGQSYYVADESSLTVTGEGELFVATRGV